MEMQNQQDSWEPVLYGPEREAAQTERAGQGMADANEAREQTETGGLQEYGAKSTMQPEGEAVTMQLNMENAAPDTDGAPPDASAEKNHQLYPYYRPEPLPPPKINTGEEHVLFVQLVLCMLFLAFTWFSRSSDAPYLAELRGGFDAMMTSGVEFSTDNVFARFADAAVEELRLKMRVLLESLEEPEQIADGEGGFWPTGGQRAVPEGASVEEYTLPIELSSPLADGLVLTSEYGFRQNPVNGEDDFHAGLDIRAAEGTPVLCAQDGIVVRTGHSRLRGYYVIVRHEGGVQTLYQHLSLVLVRGGEVVTRGQTLAASGSTGFVTGPHLHLELILDGVRVDPARSLPVQAG